MGKGKKERLEEKKRQVMMQRQEERRAEKEERQSQSKERRKKKYNRAEDKEWQSHFDKFALQLRAQNLQIKDVAGDGNCFFRAVSDQLYGTPDRYDEVRQTIVQHMEDNREMFEPFIEDDEPFDRYCKSMRKNGRWGGHLEIQAASMLYRVNILIYQLALPRWDVVNFPGGKNITLSYHDGEHYNSVHPLAGGVANLPSNVTITKTNNNSNNNNNAQNRNNHNNNNTLNKNVAKNAREEEKKEKLKPTEVEKRVMAQTGCYDVQLVHDILEENFGDEQATIDTLQFLYQADTGAFPSSQDWDNSCEILAEADQIALAQEESLYKQEKDLASVNNAPLISDDTKPDEENISRGKSEESKRSAEEAEDKDKPLTEAEKEFARKQRLLQRMQQGKGHMSNAERKAQMKLEKEIKARNTKNAKNAKKATGDNNAINSQPDGAELEVPPEIAVQLPAEAFTALRI